MSLPPEQYVIDSDGKKTGVILALSHYERLLEDLHDLAVVTERREEDTLTLEDLHEHLVEVPAAVPTRREPDNDAP